MKHTLPPLIAFISLCAPAWADMMPLPESNKEVDSYIECVEDPESTSEEIFRCAGILDEWAGEGVKRARQYVAKVKRASKDSSKSKHPVIERMQKRCDEKDEQSCYYLTLMYYNGVLVTENQSMGIFYEARQVELGDWPSAIDLARNYLGFEGFPQDHQKAAYYFQKYFDLRPPAGIEARDLRDGCNLKVAQGCYLLGDRLFRKQSYEEARTYYQKAADLGHRPAIELLKLLDPFPKADQKPAEEKASEAKPAETTKTPETETPVTP